jgi:hypothetical protein
LEIKKLGAAPILRAAIEFANEVKTQGVRQPKSRQTTKVALFLDDTLDRAYELFKNTADEQIMASCFEVVR